jgi:hypothetical protein
VGTWDGTTFTVVEQPSPPTHAKPDDEHLDFSAPCPERDGGRPTAFVSFEQFQAFMAASQAPPDFAALWVDQRTNPADPGRDVYTVAYTGDIDAHRAQLQAIWPGPLCVMQFTCSMTELKAIQQNLSNRLEANEFELHIMGFGIDEMHGKVSTDVLVADPAVVAALDERYGTGAVELRPVLQPIT